MDFTKAKDYITQRLVNELSDDLFYHGAHHTFSVVKAATRIAALERISKKEYNLLLTAAYYHDSGFLFTYKSNEPFAVKLTTAILPQFDYSEQDIIEINKIILATQSHVSPVTLLEKIMCDADHDYIGTIEYQNIAKTLRKELKKQGVKYNDSEWIEVQLNYLINKHTYHTQSAIKDRLPQKEKVIEELRVELSHLPIN